MENPDTVAEVLGERAPWWAPPRLNEAVTSPDPPRAGPLGRRHPRRPAAPRPAWRSTRCSSSWPRDLLHDPDTQARAEALKDRLLDNPAVIRSAISLWDALRRALTASLEDPPAPSAQRLLTEVAAFAERLVSDPQLQARLDGVAADAAVFVVERYGAEVTAVITHTIERWDGREAADRIELHVGRDLQFIRINGTVVGGLVGVLIHAVSVALA